MPTWNEINAEISQLGTANACDQVRTKYLGQLEARVGRTVIAYYSGFLQKRTSDGRFHPECAITDLDMNGFMAVVHNVPRDRGLDLILHTPGGGTEATTRLLNAARLAGCRTATGDQMVEAVLGMTADFFLRR